MTGTTHEIRPGWTVRIDRVARLDDQSDPFWCRTEMTGTLLHGTEEIRVLSETLDVDLRGGSDAGCLLSSKLVEARRDIQAFTERRVLRRMIRHTLEWAGIEDHLSPSET